MRAMPWLNPHCPACDSGTISHGQMKGRPRYKCKSCDRTFTPRSGKSESEKIKEMMVSESTEFLRRIRLSEDISLAVLEQISGHSSHVLWKIERNRGVDRWRTVCDVIEAMGYDVIIRRRADG